MTWVIEHLRRIGRETFASLQCCVRHEKETKSRAPAQSAYYGWSSDNARREALEKRNIRNKTAAEPVPTKVLGGVITMDRALNVWAFPMQFLFSGTSATVSVDFLWSSFSRPWSKVFPALHHPLCPQGTLAPPYRSPGPSVADAMMIPLPFDTPLPLPPAEQSDIHTEQPDYPPHPSYSRCLCEASNGLLWEPTSAADVSVSFRVEQFRGTSAGPDSGTITKDVLWLCVKPVAPEGARRQGGAAEEIARGAAAATRARASGRRCEGSDGHVRFAIGDQRGHNSDSGTDGDDARPSHAVTPSPVGASGGAIDSPGEARVVGGRGVAGDASPGSSWQSTPAPVSVLRRKVGIQGLVRTDSNVWDPYQPAGAFYWSGRLYGLIAGVRVLPAKRGVQLRLTKTDAKGTAWPSFRAA